jgi:nucleotide-binding universal stress UspA family protein
MMQQMNKTGMMIGPMMMDQSQMQSMIMEQILKYTLESKIDLIIIASQRLNKFSKIKALGSVSRKISENANCLVMIIH